MAVVNSLRSHLIEELTDLLDAETQLTGALPKMAQASTSKPLRGAFRNHLKETRGHIARLKQALRDLGEKPTSKACEAMQGLLEEGETMMQEAREGALRDAVMITAAQKVEHYEMASYGTARTYAQVLGERSVARLLGQTLKEEKAADRTLTTIARGSVNEEAAEEWQQEEEGPLSRTAEWAGSTAASASRRIATGLRSAASSMGLAQERSTAGRGRGRARTTGRRAKRSGGKKR